MPVARNTVVPDSDQTKYILLNSVGDMEFLPRPADNSRWHLTDIIITVDTPGTDTVNVTIKSDMNIIAVIPINKSVSNIATSTGLIGNFGEPINVEIDAAVNVHFTASYYQRKDGTMFNPLSDPFSPTDVANITTTLGVSTNMLRVAAAGGLEYRTTTQILSDIGAAPLASPTFTGTVTLPTTIASVIKPASDSTTALQLANAAGTAVLTVDTTNNRLKVSGADISIVNSGGSSAWLRLQNAVTGTDFNGFAIGRHNDSKNYVFTFENEPIVFGTNNTVRTRLSAAGLWRFGADEDATAAVDIAASTTAAASLRIRSGTAPTTPNAGDIWNDGTDFNLYGSGLKLHTGVIKPASDSTTALQLANAAGTAVVTVDTTNSKLDITGNLDLDNTTSSTTGVITKGGVAFIHNFQHPTGSTAVPAGRNTFIGEGAGNFTIGSTATSTSHGSYNVVMGYQVLYSNTTGYSNVATGYQALYSNTTGYSNTAQGTQSLRSNTTGYENSAHGTNSLYANTTGVYNTAQGANSLYANTTGGRNTTQGANSLRSNTTGSYNSAYGYEAGRYVSGGGDNQTPNNSVYLGYDTRASANGNTNEIVIGASAIGAGSNSVTLGNTSVTKTVIRGITEFSGTMGNSTKTVGTDAPIDWVQITIGGVAGYIPVYAA